MGNGPQYSTMEEKVQDIERYLIRQVDVIRKWVGIAVILCAVCAAAAITSLVVVSSRTDGDTAGVSTPVEQDQLASASAEGVPSQEAVAKKDAPAAAKSEPKPAPKKSAPKSTPGSSSKSVATSPTKDLAQAKSAPTSPAKRPSDTAPAVPDDARTTSRPNQKQAPTPPAVTTGLFRVGASAIATEIVSLEPVGTGDTFDPSVPRLFCWTRVETDNLGRIPDAKRRVTHRWIHDGRVIKERRISIGSARYRVYSIMSSPGALRGDWRVDILDADGQRLGSESFRIE